METAIDGGAVAKSEVERLRAFVTPAIEDRLVEPARKQARLGRAASLGARSIGVLDAGATSCCLILQTMAASLSARL